MEYTRTLERSFNLEDGALLRVANRRGELVVRGEERDDIAVTAQIRVNAMTRDEADDRFGVFELPMSQSGRTVEVGPPRYDEPHPTVLFGISLSRFMKGPRLDLVIRVPRTIEVEAEASSGLIRVEGIQGRCRIAGKRTKIEASDLEGDVRIEGQTGRVEVRRVRGSLEVEVRSGKISVKEIVGPVRLHTSTGEVRVRDVQGDCTIETRAGKLSVEDVEGTMKLSTTIGSVSYRGRIAHDIDLTVRTGSVQLAVTQDSAFFIDAESRTGSVSADLPVNFLEEPPADAATVRVRVGTGSIQIVPA